MILINGQSMTIKDANSFIKYFFSDKSVLSTIEKSIELPDKYVTFSLKKDDFANLMSIFKAQLNLPDIIVEAGCSKVVIKTLDCKSSTSNVYDIEMLYRQNIQTMFKKENFKMIPGDYDIAISKKNFTLH